jgi:hypothetical protein
MSSDAFNQTLTWLHARTDHRFTLAASMIVIDEAALAPAFRNSIPARSVCDFHNRLAGHNADSRGPRTA